MNYIVTSATAVAMPTRPLPRLIGVRVSGLLLLSSTSGKSSQAVSISSYHTHTHGVAVVWFKPATRSPPCEKSIEFECNQVSEDNSGKFSRPSRAMTPYYSMLLVYCVKGSSASLYNRLSGHRTCGSTRPWCRAADFPRGERSARPDQPVKWLILLMTTIVAMDADAHTMSFKARYRRDHYSIGLAPAGLPCGH